MGSADFVQAPAGESEHGQKLESRAERREAVDPLQCFVRGALEDFFRFVTPDGSRVAWSGRAPMLTDGYRVWDVLDAHHIPKKDTPLSRAFARRVVVVIVEDHAGRVDDAQPALHLHRLKLLRVPSLRRDRAHLG